MLIQNILPVQIPDFGVNCEECILSIHVVTRLRRHGLVAGLSNYYLFMSCDWEMYKLWGQENSDV